MSKSNNNKNKSRTNMTLSPLLSALTKAFKMPKTPAKPSTPVPKIEGPHKQSAIRFETIEPRVLLSGDLNPAQTVSGSIDVQGELDQYGFTLTQNTRIVFDSQTNNYNINWSLSGPKGTEVSNRSFTHSDSVDASVSPLLDLAAGDYTLTVDADSDQTGAYSFRLIDMLKAQEVTPGTTVTGKLDAANQTNVYKFNATSGEHYYFNSLSLSGGSTYWRLIDPNGNNVFGPAYFTGDADITTPVDGSYTLLVEGRVSAAGSSNYSFNVQKVADDQASLALGETVSGSIAHAGQRDFYSFNLIASKQLYFDSLTNNYNLNWTLIGPRGTVVSARDFTSSDSGNISGSAVYDVVAGNYTLIVDGNTDTVGDYSFRLFDINQAMALTPGTTVTSQLNPGNETDLYQFNVSAGERYYFDAKSISGSPYWRLLDPYGQVVFGPSYMGNDNGPLTLTQAGVYTLLIEGTISNAGASTYSFNVQKVTDEQFTLILGDAVNGSIGHVGQRDFYSFSLSNARQLYFDALNNSNVNWSLLGPRGTVVSGRSFTSSDSGNISGSAIYDVVAGDYTLVIDGNAGMVGDYSFRLLDIAQATLVAPGTPVTGQFNPANETDLYQFNATAGDRYVFDSQSLSNTAYWRLLDPYDQLVFGPNYMGSDTGIVTLTQTGTYTLLTEGYLGSTGTTSYQFNLDYRGNVPVNPLPAGTALSLGATVAGVLPSAGANYYSFNLSNDDTVYFDALSNSNVNWTLTGPRGTVVSARTFTYSDSGNLGGSAAMRLAAGDYSLRINGPASIGYSFRLLDTSQAIALTPGTVVSGQLSPANETDLYQFNVTAGERFYFDYQSFSVYSYWASWRLLDPNGQLVFGPDYFYGDKEPLTLTQNGIYTLLIEGYVYDTGTRTYSFNVQKVTDEQYPLTLGNTVNGSIAHAGQRDFYSFSLPEAKQLYFDALSDSNVNWTLLGTRGAVVSGRNFTGTDSRSISGSAIYGLATGDYTLIIDGNGDMAGNYSFRVLDIALATALTLGTEVSNQLSPGNETDVYQFNVTAGEQFYFDAQSFSGNFWPYWRLLDPNGFVVFGPDTFYTYSDYYDKGPLTLTKTGVYTLLIEGYVYDAGAISNYSFNVHKVTDDQATLTVGDTVSSSIAHVGQRDFYSFSLAEAKQLYFDALSDSDVNWTLVGPRGTVVSGRNLTRTDAGSLGGSAIYGLVAGDYTLIIDGNADRVGNYSFRLLDIALATALTPGMVVSSQLSPANETDLYQFNVTAGERFYFDYKNYSGNYTPYWRLLDPHGQWVFGPDGFYYDKEPLTLTKTGAYTLLIEGYVYDTEATSDYSFNVQKVSDDQTTLTLGNTVNGSIAHVGQRDFYSFTLSEAKQLYFDALSNSNVNWTLVGPRGTVVSGRNFTSTDAGSLSGSAIYDLAAGDYTLIIDGNDDRVGNYSFRVLDIAQATAMTPGTAVSGQLSPANETDLYQFNVTAGERFYFDYQSFSVNSYWAYWRLLDPNGFVVFGPDALYNDKEPLTLTQTGVYTLLIEGYVYDTGARTYSFNVQKVSDDQTPLTLGNTVNGSIAHVGQRDFYSFSLSVAKQLYLDVLSNSNVNWTLVGPRGAVVSGRNFTSTDSGNLSGSAIYGLVAGDYTLIIDGNDDRVGNYSFRVLDIAQATALTPGTTVSGQLSPANETDLYQFNVTAGERFYFDYQSFSVNSYWAYWRLLDPNGFVVFGPDALYNDKEPLTLTQTGVYTLLIEGYVYDTGARTYSFNVQKVTDEQSALTLGNTVNASIAHVGQRDFYSFSLSEAKQLYFDALSNSNVNWTLVGPRGTVVSGRNFTSTDAGSLSGSAIYDLAAGDYTLIIDGNADRVGDYSFRLLDIAQAKAITPGTPVTGQFNPANETDVYQFKATAGDQYVFDSQSLSNTAYWRLLDPYGQLVFGPAYMGSDTGPLHINANRHLHLTNRRPYFQYGHDQLPIQFGLPG